MLIKNTTKQPRGMHLAGGTLIELPPGEPVEVPGAAFKKACETDPVIKGWFESDELVEVTPKAKAAPAPAGDAEPDTKGPKK